MLFISHSSEDMEIVQALVELVRFGLVISPDRIRCTSLPGYRLPGGAEFNEQLRREVNEAKAFVGLISQNSLESMYVMFELGARWGADKQLIPLLTPGCDSTLIKEPLSRLHMLRCDSVTDLQQFLSELGKLLKCELNPTASYQSYIDKVVSLRQISNQIIIPKYLEKYLKLDFDTRKNELTNSQKEILNWLEMELERRDAVPQRDFKNITFDNKVIASDYWRLESLCLLGFLSKEIIEYYQGKTPRYAYRLSEEYKNFKLQNPQF